MSPHLNEMLQHIADNPTDFRIHGIAADAAEDEDLPYLARSLRHMAEDQRVPFHNTFTGGFTTRPSWVWTDSPSPSNLPYEDEPDLASELPSPIYSLLPTTNSYRFGSTRHYTDPRSAHDAYHQAHEAWQRLQE